MLLGDIEIARLDALLAALGADSEGALEQALPRLLPGFGYRHCEAADVLEEPFRTADAADIHLLDTRGHCIQVTSDPAEATAFLIARKTHTREAAK